MVDWKALRQRAERARDNAYAPYSRFYVGAALLARDGRIFEGANVENVSYGLTICAERSAIASAVTQGAKTFEALVVVSSGQRATPPCGACRQVLFEFAPSFPIRLIDVAGNEVATDVLQLLPLAFENEHLGR